ncbi:MAG TPA: carbonic anhydrase family protein [Casimicrobiaceae bacterium]|nr:carbonic anhydrase family protein [Casimicrobiaceae bacterium]
MILYGQRLAILVGVALAIGAVGSYAAEGGHWTYAGATGPAKWGSLEKGFALCKLGTTQSPIDIPDADARKGDLPGLLFNYKPSPLKIVDNGHTIQVDYAPGSFVTVAGKRYELVQFHFHRPSEEKINGKSHDMVAHLVHRDADGKLAVVAVLLDAGKESRLIKTLWDNLPQEKGKEKVVEALKINAVELLPENKGYYTFTGSLTTPPCSESVTWFVLKTPVQVSDDGIARFARSYPMNARPVQPLNGRDIQATR